MTEQQQRELARGLRALADSTRDFNASPHIEAAVLAKMGSADNAAAASRVDPNGAFGAATCVSGFVWREAFPGDVVCVEPWVRGQVANDNRIAPTRTEPNPGEKKPVLFD